MWPEDEHAGISRSSTQATAATAATGSEGGAKPRLSIPLKFGGPRGRSPGLKWGPPISEKSPRCLVVDYVQGIEAGHDDTHTQRVQAQELRDIRHLKSVHHCGRPPGSLLRVFHVQNWPEASGFLCHVLRLHDNSDLTGQAGFADWVKQKQPRRRAGKPLLVGKTWKVASDPWRRVTKTAIGVDYMKPYTCSDSTTPENKTSRVHGLMGYDSNDNPVRRHEVYSQRMAMYVQQSIPDMPSPGPDVVSPYHNPWRQGGQPQKPAQDLYENGNVIVVFDNADSGSTKDNLIPARGEIESRWRRLPFYLSQLADASDDTLASDCMHIITSDVLKALAHEWDHLLDVAWDHVSILEEKIYENPEDESRAPELWRNSANWLKYEKLMSYHTDAVEDMRKYLAELDGDISDEGVWLRDAPADFARLTSTMEDDLVKRTANLADLMYKSVGIRDSRESLQLGTSMWRLSWITFIFLPLTFITGFFGMNVDTFSNDPSMKWYFISVVPFMICILAGWYLLKHLFARHRQSPMERGAYERLFTALHNERPELWSRIGPREYLQPKGWKSQWKWTLMLRWTAGKATRPSADDDPIGAWNRVKRFFIRRWTPEIQLDDPHADGEQAIQSLSEAERGEAGLYAALQENLPVAAGMAPADFVIEGLKRSSDEIELRNLESGSNSARNSRILVEERTTAHDGESELRQEHPGDALTVPMSEKPDGIVRTKESK